MRKLLVMAALLVPLALPHLTFATAAEDYGLSDTGTEAFGAEPTGSKSDITQFVGAYIIKPILTVVGVAFLVLTIYGGVLWMVAAGNETMVKKAQDILRSAAIGVVIIVSAYAITNAILNALTTGDVNSGT